jgi:hypothetical protein
MSLRAALKGCGTSPGVAARLAAGVVVACATLTLALVSACGAPPPVDHATTFTPAHRTTGEAFSHFFNTHTDAGPADRLPVTRPTSPSRRCAPTATRAWKRDQSRESPA